MATIYRFIVENKYSGRGSGGRNTASSEQAPRKATAKGKWVNALGSPRGGVEHGRRMRAINPLLNRATGGYWEKGMRVGRASMGLVQRNTETGQLKIGGIGFAIIIAFIIQSMLQLQKKNLEWGKQRNTQNYKQMETGVSQVHGEYQIMVNGISGRRTYNENK